MSVRSSAPNPVRAITCALALTALAAGCAREAPEIREVRKAAQEYLRALAKRDVKEIGERSTCVVSANSIVGGTVLGIGPPRKVRMGTLDSLSLVTRFVQRTADSTWAFANDSTADSLFRAARLISNQAAVYRSAVRAVPVSAPGTVVPRDSTVETRSVRTRIRYAGPAIGPQAVDKEEIIRLLRAPGGKWIVFSVYLTDQDPRPEMI